MSVLPFPCFNGFKCYEVWFHRLVFVIMYGMTQKFIMVKGLRLKMIWYIGVQVYCSFIQFTYWFYSGDTVRIHYGQRKYLQFSLVTFSVCGYGQRTKVGQHLPQRCQVSVCIFLCLFDSVVWDQFLTGCPPNYPRGW